MKKPVILVIENSVDYTGALHSILANAITLRETFSFYFLLPVKSRAITFIEQENFEVIQLPLLEINRSIKNLVLYLPRLIVNGLRLNQILRKNQIDLIVSNDFYNMLPPMHRLLGGRSPYVTFVRFIPDRFPRSLVNAWMFFHFHFASKIISVSEVVKKGIRLHHKSIKIYNEKPSGGNYKFYEYDADSKLVLFMSNYIPGKGLEYAVRAFASLPEKFHGWKLKFVGSDMGLPKNSLYKNSLLEEVKKLRLESRIVLESFSNNVVEEYRQAAIVLNFSDSESFSLTCMEAMYVGRPVIATKSGGPEEMIISGYNGELVNVRDVKGMSAAIHKLMADPDLRRSYGLRAHQTVSTNFSAENTTMKLITIFNEAIISSR
jgi:L-malate glycosyltransferase